MAVSETPPVRPLRLGDALLAEVPFERSLFLGGVLEPSGRTVVVTHAEMLGSNPDMGSLAADEADENRTS
ncbi:MAG: hypothetical protein HMLKMBBP_03124 [Planctomycetes bacterium]|nr:hypothetical protein [Planctomycetota bacterium]